MAHVTAHIGDRYLTELRAAAALEGCAVSELVRRALIREARAVLAAAPEGWGDDEDLAKDWRCTGCKARVAARDAFCRSCGARFAPSKAGS